MDVYESLSLIALVVNLLIGVYVLSKGPGLQLNRLLFLVLASLVAWSAGEFIMRSAGTAAAARAGACVAAAGWCLVGGFFLVFTLAFTERRRPLRNPLTYVVVFSPGLLFMALTWWSDLVLRDFVPSYWGFRGTGGMLRLPSELYVAALFLASVGLLFLYYRNAPSPRKRLNTGYLLAATMIPVATGLVTDILFPLAGTDVVELAVFASAAIGPIVSYAVVNHGLLTTVSLSLGSAIIDKIEEAVVVADPDGIIETVNQAALDLTGFDKAEISGKRLSDLFVGYEVDSSRPGDRSASAGCLTSDGGRIPVSLSVEQVRRKSGSLVGSVILAYDMRESLRLVNARREKEEASRAAAADRFVAEALIKSGEELRRMSDFFENVIDNIREPVFIKDRELAYVFVNRALCELAGLERERFLGKTNDDLLPDPVASRLHSVEERAFEEGQVLSTYYTGVAGRSGRPIDLKALYAPLFDERGAVTHVIGTFNDITEQKRLDNARLDFIRVAAHELRTPLTSLKLGFEMLARETRGSLNSEQQRSLDVLSMSIERLSGLARNLLDLASMEAGLLKLDRRPVALGELIEEVVGSFTGSCSQKGLYCRVELDGPLEPASADPGRLYQVLYNLLGNAVKFTESGGITVSARQAEDGLLEVRVSDTGPGISPERRRTIFTTFASAGRRDAGKDGTGLGLSITKAIVEAHGGSVWVESVPGAGSDFYFTVRTAGAGGGESPAAEKRQWP